MNKPLALSIARHNFKIKVLAADRGCIAARSSRCEGDVQAHHVITQQQLRKVGLEEHLWDPGNGAATCERHHRRHHNRTEPISEMALPQRCLDFIAEHDLDRLLDRYYDA